MRGACEPLADLTRVDLVQARKELLAALADTEDPTAAGVLLAEVNRLGEALNRL